MEARKLVLTALLMGVVAVVTMMVNVPLPGVKGYVNMGDTVVLLSGLLFGPVMGAAAGGLGSALADLLLGYAYWAPWTLAIKGVEGLLAGWLMGRVNNKPALAAAPAGAVMVLGYFFSWNLSLRFRARLGFTAGGSAPGWVSVGLCVILLRPLQKYLSL